MKKLYPLIILLFLLSFHLNSQNMLVLKSTQRLHIDYYPVGSFLSIGMDSLRYAGRITSLTDSMLVLKNRYYVPIGQIDCIYEERWFVNFISAAAKLMGFTYFSLTAVNRTLNKEYPVIDTETLLISGGLLGGAILLDLISEKKIEIGKKWQFEVIDTDLQVLE